MHSERAPVRPRGVPLAAVPEGIQRNALPSYEHKHWLLLPQRLVARGGHPNRNDPPGRGDVRPGGNTRVGGRGGCDARCGVVVGVIRSVCDMDLMRWNRVQDDLAIMMEGSDGRYYFQAGAICLPGALRNIFIVIHRYPINHS